MSSAAAAGLRAFGLDRGLPFPVSDIAQADAVLLVGANVAETMPPIMQCFDAQRLRRRPADRRRSAPHRRPPRRRRCTCELMPGTDARPRARPDARPDPRAADRRGLHPRAHRGVRSGPGARRDLLARARRADHRRAAARHRRGRARRWAGRARAWCSRPAARSSSRRASANVLAFINLALALGRVGRPFNGYGCLTGQGNGQGGREHGQKADQLPGYRRHRRAAAREHDRARCGASTPRTCPGPGRSAYELLDSLGRDRGVRGLFVMGSNPVVSAPHATHIEERLGALDLLVVCDFFLSETARLADVVLPVGAVGGGGRHDDQPRGPRAPPARSRAAAGGRADRPRDAQRSGQSAGSAEGRSRRSPHAVFDELREATAGAPADYSRHHAGAHRPRARRVLAVPIDATPPGRRGCSRIGSTRRTGRARFHRVQPIGPAERPDVEYPFYLTTGRILAQYQSGTQTRRVARLRKAAREAVAEMHPRGRAALGPRQRRRGHHRDPPRPRLVPAPHHAAASAKTRSSCPFTGPGSSRRTG